MRAVIIGCGYVGSVVGQILAREGHEVYGVRRTGDERGELAAAGIHPIEADIARPQGLKRLPDNPDWVVNCASSGRSGVEQYRRVFLEGSQNLIQRWQAAPPSRYVFTGSTSVYAQNDETVVTEESSTAPTTETGQVLVETERQLRDAFEQLGFPAITLRVAAIYGPGRGYLFQQYLKDQAKITGNPQRFLNMIHRDDVAGAIVAALTRGKPGQTYNVVDDEPVRQIAFYQWLSDKLQKPMPPYADEEEAVNRKRALTNKRISNRRLKEELEYKLKYPTYREGYAAEIAKLSGR